MSQSLNLRTVTHYANSAKQQPNTVLHPLSLEAYSPFASSLSSSPQTRVRPASSQSAPLCQDSWPIVSSPLSSPALIYLPGYLLPSSSHSAGTQGSEGINSCELNSGQIATASAWRELPGILQPWYLLTWARAWAAQWGLSDLAQ